MSDKMKINQAIDKAATECVEELLAASGKNGGKPWLEIVRRKMRQAFVRLEPATLQLRLGGCEFQRFRGGIRIVTLVGGGHEFQKYESEAAILDAASTAKLAQWLNGGE